MKKRFVLIIALILTVFTIKAQDENIPSEVVSAFSEKFSDINHDEVDWGSQGGNYKAEFSKEEKDYEVLFENTGKWLSTEVQDLTYTELPEEIKEGLSKRGHEESKVDEIEMTENPDGTTYKIEVKDGMRDHDVYFDDEGNLMREEC
jgi:hypothetical protein